MFYEHIVEATSSISQNAKRVLQLLHCFGILHSSLGDRVVSYTLDCCIKSSWEEPTGEIFGEGSFSAQSLNGVGFNEQCCMRREI